MRDPPSASPVLPQEICDEIIDFAKDCSETMKLCTRVCRNWLPRARANLFYDFTFPPENQQEQLNDCNPDTIVEEIMLSIDNMNASPLTPSLFSLVRRLTINVEWMAWLLQVVPALSFQVSFKNLAHIRLCRPDNFSRLNPVSMEAKSLSGFLEQQQLSRLESFILDSDLFFPLMTDFFEMYHRVVASRANRLHTLAIHGVYNTVKFDDVDSDMARHIVKLPKMVHPPRLRILKLDAFQLRWAEHILSPLHLFDTSSLHTLIIVGCSPSDLKDSESLRCIFGQCGSLITSLLLEITYITQIIPVLPQHQAFGHLTNLDHFALKLSSNDYFPNLLRNLLMAVLPCFQNLQRLTIIIVFIDERLHWVTQYFNEDLDDFFVSLTRTSNPRLAAINVCMPAGTKRLETSISSNLLKTKESGLLKICVGCEVDPFMI